MLLDLRGSVDQVDVGSQLRKQRRDGLRAVLEVVVHRDDDVVSSCADSGEKGVVLTEVAEQVQANDAGNWSTEFSDHVPAVIGAAVDHEDEFPVG